MKSSTVDENLSILNYSSGGMTASGIRNETQEPLYQPPSKKKRNLPGNPDPEAEVMALSPKTLMATNRFICEICSKGFQREQNLQLHRRGHNLPWKLKQRSNKEVRKKVYVCPEATCVHHHPSRALGDLTGIKKHFCRKHGEKKWKCEKCSKGYAVQSDWKAHSKICGTREYRCDCGTLFSRRDSFITHRAFCDALAQQCTSVTSSAMAAMNPLLQNASFRPFPVKREDQDRFFSITSQVPSWLAASCDHIFPPIPTFDNGQSVILQNHQQNPNPTSAASSAAVSASALLQKAGQMGSSDESPLFTAIQPHDSQYNAVGFVGSGSVPFFVSCHGKTSSEQTPETPTLPPPPPSLFHEMMSFEEASFEEALSGILLNRTDKEKEGGGGDEGETRDFLGLRALGRSDQIFSDEINDMNFSSAFGAH